MAQAPASPLLVAPPIDGTTKVKLSIMMFLQYAIWGSWLPLFFGFLTGHRGLTALDAGYLFSIGAVGALLAPFIAGQIADRWFNTEKFLAVSHLVGAVLVWQLATVTSWPGLVACALLYSIIYAPTLALTNSLAFHHLPDRDRDFGKVRIWGTIGWIAAGIGVAQWLLYAHTPAGASPAVVKAAQLAGAGDSLRLSAILGVIMGAFCFLLPKTPPARGKQSLAAVEALQEIVRSRALLVLFLVSFPVSCILQFYFVLTAPFLQATVQLSQDSGAGWFINRVFGAGGGGLMTIGQISELAVLAVVPMLVKRFPRKTFLLIGLAAYALRFAVFAYLPYPAAVIPALALHGVCFGCFFFIAFMIVDQETTRDVRASAQGMYNLVVMGLGTIVGNLFAGKIADVSKAASGETNYRVMFSIPMWIAIGCLVAFLLAYPRRGRSEPAPVR